MEGHLRSLRPRAHPRRPENRALLRRNLRTDDPMARGPNGQRRPNDVVGCAVMVARIAVGEVVMNPPLGRS